MNLTEPQAGSDLARACAPAPSGPGTAPTASRARRSSSPTASTTSPTTSSISCWRACRTRRPARAASRCSSCRKFCADGTRNDVRCHSIEHKLGIHASPTCTMIFGDHDGAVGWLVGEENRGLACMFTMMNNARLAVGLQGVAIAERAYQQALHYAQRAPAGPRAGCARRHEPDRRAPGRAAQAADHEGADRGGARDLLPDGRRHRPRASRGRRERRAGRRTSARRC